MRIYVNCKTSEMLLQPKNTIKHNTYFEMCSKFSLLSGKKCKLIYVCVCMYVYVLLDISLNKLMKKTKRVSTLQEKSFKI